MAEPDLESSIDLNAYTFYPSRIDRLHVGWLSPAQNSLPVWQQLENRALPYCSLTSRFLVNSSRSGRSVRPREVYTWVPGLSPIHDFKGEIPLAKSREQRKLVWTILKKRKEVEGLGGVLPSLDPEEVTRAGIWRQSARDLKNPSNHAMSRLPPGGSVMNGGQKDDSKITYEDVESTIQWADGHEELSHASSSEDAENGLFQKFRGDALSAENETRHNDIQDDASDDSSESQEPTPDTADEPPPTIEELAETKPFFVAATGRTRATALSPRAVTSGLLPSNSANHAGRTEASQQAPRNIKKRKRKHGSVHYEPETTDDDDMLDLCNVHAGRFYSLYQDWVKTIHVLPPSRRADLMHKISEFSQGTEKLAESLRRTRKAYAREQRTFEALKELPSVLD